MKSRSAPGTPLTVKWTAAEPERNETEAATESRSNLLQLAALVGGFALGLIAFALGSWFLEQKFVIGDSLLGGLWTCLRLQRWGEKHGAWNKLERRDPGSEACSATEIKQRRRAYSVPGVVCGFAAGALSAWLQGEMLPMFGALVGALAGYELATQLGERFGGLPTLDDLALVSMKEEMSPLDLKSDHQVPVTLKRSKEEIAKR